MLIGMVLITVMFFTMIFSIGEMSAAMPHTGGAYSFSRAAMGPWGGFVTGFAETIEYVVTTAVVVWCLGGWYADSALSLLHRQHQRGRHAAQLGGGVDPSSYVPFLRRPQLRSEPPSDSASRSSSR